MKRLSCPGDEVMGSVTYDIGNGRHIRFTTRDIQEYGLKRLLDGAGLEAPKDRVPVMQDGVMVGTVPALFEPCTAKSRTFLYEPRGGDFVRQGDKWIANPTLGPGDLEAVIGFRPA